MSKLRKICNKQCLSFTLLLRIVMIISIIIALWRRDWVWVVGTCIGFFVSILPSIIKKDAKFIKTHLRKKMDVFVYFNNDISGYAPKNAEELLYLIRKKK